MQDFRSSSRSIIEQTRAASRKMSSGIRRVLDEYCQTQDFRRFQLSRERHDKMEHRSTAKKRNVWKRRRQHLRRRCLFGPAGVITKSPHVAREVTLDLAVISRIFMRSAYCQEKSSIDLIICLSFAFQAPRWRTISTQLPFTLQDIQA